MLGTGQVCRFSQQSKITSHPPQSKIASSVLLPILPICHIYMCQSAVFVSMFCMSNSPEESLSKNVLTASLTGVGKLLPKGVK